MFRKKCLLTLFCIVQGAYFVDIGTKHTDNYGPYDINIKFYESIKGPKQKSITALNVSIIKQNGDYYCHANLTVFEQGRLEEAKVTVYSVEGNRKSLLWNYRHAKPCTHFVLGPIFENYFHASNCVFKKDSYIIEINLSEEIKNFLGTSFFYGEYLFKACYFNKNANIMGIILDISFTKKKPGN